MSITSEPGDNPDDRQATRWSPWSLALGLHGSATA